MSKVTEELNSKFNLKRILIIVVILIIIIVAVIITTHVLGRPYDSTNNTFKEITINEGDSTKDIAIKLHDKKIIGDESMFVGLSAFELKNGKYKPGKYLLSPSMNFEQLTSTMINGITTNSGFTIPSGYTVRQTIDALDQAAIINSNDFDAVIESVDFSSSFDFIDTSLAKEEQLEGFLFPDTYTVNSNANAMMLITTMLDNFDNNFTDEYRARADELGLSIKDIVIIASMIEKTTVHDREKSTISSVIHNRINIGIPLKNGYPDKPLCSPGKESIKAALYPDDTDYIFYIMSPSLDGTHLFASSAEEYKELLEKYKAAKSNQGSNS